MNAQPLGLGVVGLGLAGGVMVAAARTHPGIRLAAAADQDPELRSRFGTGEGLPAVADVGELVSRDDVEAVYVATPHQLHRDHAVAAAEAGKHVVVEKPMALTLTDCDDMIAAARANGVWLVVGHTHGFDPAVATIRELVASGRFGAIGMVSAWNYTDFLYRPRRPEELDPARGGGILLNQVPHQVEIVRTIVDRPVVGVRASTTVLDPTRPVEGSCAALLEFAGGGCACVVYSGYDHFDSDELHGWIAEGGGRKTPAHGSARRALRDAAGVPEGTARSRLGYGGRPASRPGHQPHFGELVVTCASADLRVGADEVLVYGEDGVDRVPVTASPWWPGRGEVLEELVAAVRTGQPPRHDGGFGRETVRICLAIAESARARRDVALGPTESGEHVTVH